MRGIRTTARACAWAGILVALGATAGCQGAGPKRVAAAEPGLGDPGATVVEAAPPAGTQLTWVDRHPLFSKPRDLYESSGNNAVVKAAAATVIGIPAGIVGEIKQIVVGRSGNSRL